MATTNATISISSDIMGYGVNISKSMTLKKAQSCTNLEETSGLRTKKFINTNAIAIIEADEYTAASDGTANSGHKVYIRNTSSDKANYFYIAINASAAAQTTTETIGKLYGSDWLLMPYTGGTNITVASSTTDTQYLEYIVFADGMTK
jgi:hypothetical protein